MDQRSRERIDRAHDRARKRVKGICEIFYLDEHQRRFLEHELVDFALTERLNEHIENLRGDYAATHK